ARRGGRRRVARTFVDARCAARGRSSVERFETSARGRGAFGLARVLDRCRLERSDRSPCALTKSDGSRPNWGCFGSPADSGKRHRRASVRAGAKEVRAIRENSRKRGGGLDPGTI